MSDRSVLLIDDDPDFLSALSDFLQFHLPEISTEKSESPRAAFASITARPYQALVTDLCMTPFTGFELLRGAKAIRPDMPVILFSGHLDASVRSLAFRLGAYDMLPKEGNRHELLEVLKAALEVRRLSRTVRTRHLLLHRLQNRIHAIMGILNAGEEGPRMVRRPLRLISRVSSALVGSTHTSLESLLDALWIRGRRLETLRDEAEARLREAYHASHDSCARRMTPGKSLLGHPQLEPS